MRDAVAGRLLVLSDLHLAPSGEQCVFAAHAALVGLIDHLASSSPSDPPLWLVLNGDVFDFLQIPGYDALSLPLAPQRMATILDAMDREPPQRNVVQALSRFTQAGHILSCLPGNHDPELNLVTVQQVLAARLGSSSKIPPAEGYWRIEVAGRLVVGLHGHHEDAFNAIGSAQMVQAQADGDDTVPLPPGSRLVCQVINPFRRAKTPTGQRRFPFIDRLPSEQAVVMAIMLLDPALAGKRLKDALGIGAAALIRKTLMSAGMGGQMLAQAPEPKGNALADPDWVGELASHIARGALGTAGGTANTGNQLEYELDAYFRGQTMPTAGGAKMLAAGDGALRMLLWRALGSALEATRDQFRAGTPDRLARRTIESWGREVVAVTGHTHAAKVFATGAGGTYINTGTWLDQVLPPSDTSAQAVSNWLTDLQNDALPCWSGYPVAVVDAHGARLMCWNGTALENWRDPVE